MVRAAPLVMRLRGPAPGPPRLFLRKAVVCLTSYGGLLAGLCSGLTGGVGLMPGFITGDRGRVLFEAGHGSAPKYAGMNVVNPTGLILSGALLLEWIGEIEGADRVRQAVRAVIAAHGHVTRDLGGTATTIEMTDAIIRQLSG